MKPTNSYSSIFSQQRGAIAIMIAILGSVLFAFAAFAVDLPNLMVAKNELQNAADAAALAGARRLYLDDGSMVNTGADAIAEAAAVANFSQQAAVEVASVERGHWSFGLGALARGFYENSSTDPVSLQASDEELDANINFINAVRVRVQRSGTPVASFFARIFGRTGFAVSAEATAYIGFAGTLAPWEYDQPIAICCQSITASEDCTDYTCSIGRMLNSGSDTATSNTAGWTNFSQPCGTANDSEMTSILKTACEGDGANVGSVQFGGSIGSVGGVQQNVLGQLADCWRDGKNAGTAIDTDGDGIPDQPWEVVLPVIDCPGNNVSNCSEVRGAVAVNIVWILEKEPNKIDEASCAEIPCRMGQWSYPRTDTNGQDRWNSFVQEFKLQNVDDEPAPIAKKSIYFLPDCTPHEPTGTSGGKNFGILAEIPVLVH